MVTACRRLRASFRACWICHVAAGSMTGVDVPPTFALGEEPDLQTLGEQHVRCYFPVETSDTADVTEASS